MKQKRAQRSFVFFYKERKRTQISFRSFIKNGNERKDRSVRLKEQMPNPAFNNYVLYPVTTQHTVIY